MTHLVHLSRSEIEDIVLLAKADAVRKHLADQGYSVVALLPCPDGGFHVEVEAERIKPGQKGTNRGGYTYKGQTKNVSQWAREYGISRQTFYQRLYRGWRIEKVLETPVDAAISAHGRAGIAKRWANAKANTNGTKEVEA